MVRNMCAVSGCDRVCVGYGYCSPHYQRLTNHGDVFEDIPIGARGGQYNGRWATPSQQAQNKRSFGDGESRRDQKTGRYVCTSS